MATKPRKANSGFKAVKAKLAKKLDEQMGMDRTRKGRKCRFKSATRILQIRAERGQENRYTEQRDSSEEGKSR